MLAAAIAAPALTQVSQQLPPPAPQLKPELVKEFVGKSHGDFATVRELAKQETMLVRAAWDQGAGDWETGLNDVHAQQFELPGHPDLLVDPHREAGGLLPIAQSGVENDQAVRHETPVSGPPAVKVKIMMLRLVVEILIDRSEKPAKNALRRWPPCRHDF